MTTKNHCNTNKVVVGFIPTRRELLELARYWTTVAVDIEYHWFVLAQVSGSEARQVGLAWRRVDRIHELLGEDVNKIVDKAYEEYGTKQEKRYWEAFLHGNAEQREAVREEIQRIFEEQDGDQRKQ